MTPAIATKSKKAQRTINIVLIFLVVVILLAVLYKYVIKPMRDSANAETTGNTSDGSGNSPALPSAPKLQRLGNTAVLKRGTKSQEVQWVQYYYNLKVAEPMGKTKLVKDGIFGAKTETAVLAVTGLKSTNWNSFKAKLDGVPAATSSNPSSTEWNFTPQYTYGVGTTFGWETNP